MPSRHCWATSIQEARWNWISWPEALPRTHGRDNGRRGDHYEQEGGSAGARGGARLRGKHGFELSRVIELRSIFHAERDRYQARP